jgi:hypothetical protein
VQIAQTGAGIVNHVGMNSLKADRDRNGAIPGSQMSIEWCATAEASLAAPGRTAATRTQIFLFT